MKNNPVLKKLLTVILLPIAGFILLNITFILDFLFQSVINRLFMHNYNVIVRWIPAGKHALFAAIILFISWFIFRSGLKDLYKAAYFCVPTAVILVTEGICLYRWPAALYAVCITTYGVIIFYLYKTKKSWVFYYSVTWIALTLLIMGITGVEI